MSQKLETLVSQIGQLTALELAELVKSLESAFGVSAAAPVAVAAAGPASDAGAGAQKEEEKSEYKVELIESGADKIKVIKALRQVKKDLGLTEAKAMVEGVPAIVAQAASKDEAKVMKETLEAAGAKVKLS